VFPLGTPAAALERVEVNIINGADIVTSGIDAYIQYAFEDVLGGELTVGAQATHTIEYDSDDFKDINGLTLAEGGDFVGLLNDGGPPFTSKPDTKGDIFLKYQNGIHQGTLVARYVADYEDAIPPTPASAGVPGCCGNLDEIDEQWTFDAHYILSLMEERAIVSLSVINLTDEDPPLAATDLNYDPFSHDARGIIFKAGLKYLVFGG
jgi:outer membrane receptor protein involved in Fe transport